MKALLFILVLGGCASLLDDSDFARMEQPEVAYACALDRMRIEEAPGPVPNVVWVNGKWKEYYGEIASGA